MSFSRRLEGLIGDPPKIMCTAPSSPRYIAPEPSSLSRGWPSLLGWIQGSWLEGVVDVFLDEPVVLERVLDVDLMVRARHVQELLEMVLVQTGLGWVALGV
jgi:hypothetical protein